VLRFALFLAGVAALGQSPAPSSFFAVYASAEMASSPRPTGGIVYAISAKTGLWSISGLDFNVVNKAVQTSAWTGAATPLVTPWGTRVFLLGGVGAASVGTASGYSVTGGALAEVPLKGRSTLLLGPTVIKSSVGATSVFFRVAWGFGVK
jgi:hypothetical protein